jgi:hypothetical protein
MGAPHARTGSTRGVPRIDIEQAATRAQMEKYDDQEF